MLDKPIVTRKGSMKTAQELDIRWPEPECPYSPTGSHHFVAHDSISIGNLWVCKYCLATKWLPSGWTDCFNLSIDMRKYGIQRAYWKWLDRRPRLKELLVKLQDIGMLREKLPNGKLLEVIAGIVADHSLEYREELEDEGVVFRRKKIPLEVYPGIV